MQINFLRRNPNIFIFTLGACLGSIIEGLVAFFLARYLTPSMALALLAICTQAAASVCLVIAFRHMMIALIAKDQALDALKNLKIGVEIVPMGPGHGHGPEAN